MNAMKEIFGVRDPQEAILNAKRRRFFRELREIYLQMKCTDMWFEMEDDEDLIDASIKQESYFRSEGSDYIEVSLLRL